MRPAEPLLALVTLFTATSAAPAQQPEILHAQLFTQTAAGGLAPVFHALEAAHASLWVGYTVPVSGRFESGWNASRVIHLDESGAHTYTQGDPNRAMPQDHAVLLLRLSAGIPDKLRVESPDRQIDAGGQRFVWLTEVEPAQSVAALQQIARTGGQKELRDAAVFALAVHRAPEATPALVALTAPGNDLEQREKAAFWLGAQRGHEGFLALQHLARNDADPRFREKITFNLSTSSDPGALDELIRMAHADDSPQVRRQAQFWMATKGGDKVVAGLRSATIEDPDRQVREAAVFALSRLPADQATPQLIEVAGSNRDPEVRKKAVFWLGQSSDPRALDYLTRLLTSKSPR